MEAKFISYIRSGNKDGTGFLAIPKDRWVLFDLGDRVRIKLFNGVYFFSRIVEYSHKLGVYVPKNLVKKYNLLDKETEIQMKKIRGFYAPVGQNGRIYLPADIIKEKSLHHEEIVLIKAIENGRVIREKYTKIYMFPRPKRKEFICYLDKTLTGKILEFQINKLSAVIQKYKISPTIKKFLSGMNYAFINKDLAVIFNGKKTSAIMNTNFKLSRLTFYLGAYFADGTKKGNSWAISASTFEQAKYYLKIHTSLIRDSKPEFIISYTNVNNIDPRIIEKKLTRIWKKKTGIRVNKFRIRKPRGKSITKWNKYGTLIIRERRQILLDVYNRLLKLLIDEILSKKNKKLAIDFICGVIEGDGSTPANNRGHISISANGESILLLRDIFKISEIKFHIYKEGQNKYTLRIGALEIIKKFHLLKDKIFTLYPKRKRIFFERFKKVGAVKFLTGNHSSTNWVKSWFKNNGFCDKSYQLTIKGSKLKNELMTNINKVIA